MIARAERIVAVRADDDAPTAAVESALAAATELAAWLASSQAALAGRLATQVSYPEQRIAEATRRFARHRQQGDRARCDVGGDARPCSGARRWRLSAAHVDLVTRAAQATRAGPAGRRCAPPSMRCPTWRGQPRWSSSSGGSGSRCEHCNGATDSTDWHGSDVQPGYARGSTPKGCGGSTDDSTRLRASSCRIASMRSWRRCSPVHPAGLPRRPGRDAEPPPCDGADTTGARPCNRSSGWSTRTRRGRRRRRAGENRHGRRRQRALRSRGRLGPARGGATRGAGHPRRRSRRAHRRSAQRRGAARAGGDRSRAHDPPRQSSTAAGATGDVRARAVYRAAESPSTGARSTTSCGGATAAAPISTISSRSALGITPRCITQAGCSSSVRAANSPCDSPMAPCAVAGPLDEPPPDRATGQAPSDHPRPIGVAFAP